MNSEGVEPPRWQLGSQIPQEGEQSAIELIRPLSDEELQLLDVASELLGRVAASSAYARTVDLIQAFERAHDALGRRDRPPPASALGPIVETVNSVSKALSNVPVVLTEEAREDLPAAEALVLQEQIEAITKLDGWSAAIALPEAMRDRRANLVVDEGELRLTDAGMVTVGQQGGTSGRGISEILAEGVLLAQEMVARRILAYRELIDEHGLRVRQLAVEVQFGYPVAIAMAEPDDDETSSNLKFRPFPLDRIAVLQAALRNAPVFLEGRDERTQAEDEAYRDPDLSEDRGAAGRGEIDGEDEADDGGGHEGEDVDSEESHANDSAAVPPLDLSLLIEHAARLPGEVERAWSAALDRVGQEHEHAELAARWSTVVTALLATAQSQAAELAEAGIDGRMPLPDDRLILHLLDLDGDDRAQWLAASVGQMAALQSVLAGYQQLLNRSGEKEGLGAPEDAGWWQSGAFAALRSRALALGYLSAQVDSAQARMLGGSEMPAVGVPLSGTWSHRLHLADEAQMRGDWEAAVVHLWLALRERAGQLAGVEVSAIPEEFAARLAADPELGGIGTGITLLGEVAARILRGNPPELGFSVVLVTLLATPIRRLCVGLSAILLNAVGDVGTSGGQ
jgi:hypothetical protein